MCFGIKNDMDQAYIGAFLVHLKTGEYTKSLELIDLAIKFLNRKARMIQANSGESLSTIDPQHLRTISTTAMAIEADSLYLKSLVLKYMGRF
jgi:hypothetical protein